MHIEEILIEAKIHGKTPTFIIGKNFAAGKLSKKQAVKLMKKIKQ